ARRVSSLLNQQAFCLEPQLEVDDGFHRTPLVPGCFKALQYIFPCAVVGAQCYLPNELNSFGCAAQYDHRPRADTQHRIDWKIRHGQLTPGIGRSSTHRTNTWSSVWPGSREKK